MTLLALACFSFTAVHFLARRVSNAALPRVRTILLFQSFGDHDREVIDFDDESDDEESEDEGFGSSRQQQSNSTRAREPPSGGSASGAVDYKQVCV